MKTLILKRKALALSWALATVLALAFTQCKKEETPAVTPTDDTTETLTNAPILPQGETVHITLKVNQNNDEKLDVTPPHVNFENGDTLYVASDGKYVGYLLYVGSNSEFVGDITGATAGQPLYFYLLGNRGVNGISWTVANEVTTGCSLDISNQHDYFAGQPANKQLPVVSCAPSNEDFAAGAAAQDFTAILCNQCALVKFKTNVISGKVTLGNMYNKANVNFATKTITPAATTGSISFATDANGVGWAILLPHDGAITATASAAGYDDTSVTIPTINNNAYLSDGIAVNLEAFYPLATPLTFEAMEAGASVTFTKAPTRAELLIEYSLNGGTWTTYSTPIPLTNVGDKVSFRGNNASYATGASSNNYSYFSFDKDCSVYGNIMSLVDKESFATNTTLTQTFTFCHLFGNFDSSTNQNAPNPHLYNHSSKTLVLPATTLTRGCYFDMFNGCTNLTTAPVLPATTLATSCYEGMFSGCTSLAATPTLSATTLAQSCYNSMFSGCTSLTTAPELAVTDLTNKYSCYRSMFSGCTSLTAAPALPATTIASECYKNMFKGCTSLTTAPTLPATILCNYCYDGMFSGCTNLTTAPALPATTLTESCYREMFKNCTNLTTAPTLPATTLTIFCYYEMFNGCSNLNSVTCLATNISATQCTLNWLSGVASSGTFIKASGMVVGEGGWTPNSASGIPSGWTVDVPYDPLATPLTFEAKTAGATVTFTIASAAATNSVYISTDGENWSAYTSGTAIPLANVGDKVSFRGNNARYATVDIHSYFSCNEDCYIYGNVMSLINSTDYANTKVLTQDFALKKLFYNNTHIVNHSSKTLVLPATTLTQWCYSWMFGNCTGLKTAPALPATNLAENCYMHMFSSCTSLETAPDLLATTLANSCYNGMFSGCTSLEEAPALLATNLVQSCYNNMFYGCSRLNSVTCLATSGINLNYSTYNWLGNVASSGTFTKASTMSSWPIGPNNYGSVNGIPSGWTVQDAP